MANAEFEFSDQDFQQIRRVINRGRGYFAGRWQTRAGVQPACRGGCANWGCAGLKTIANCWRSGNDPAELSEFVNALTTNLTSFFREPHHFDFLANELLPALWCGSAVLPTGASGSGRPGCSTGEEPYSIAMVVRETLPAVGWDVKILATDLDSNVLATDERGVYDGSRVKDLSEARLRRWFSKAWGAQAGQVRVAPALRDLITFKRLNLMEDWPMRGPFDIVFCRNVVIYFDKPTQRVLFERFADLLDRTGPSVRRPFRIPVQGHRALRAAGQDHLPTMYLGEST
jgi:chemotaxis protein methyltransferase CheR